MFQKHTLSSGRASVFDHRRISNLGFSDIGCLADIRCLTVMNSVWGTKSVLRLLYPVGAKNYTPLKQNIISNHSIIIKTIKGEDLCVCSENALVG